MITRPAPRRQALRFAGGLALTLAAPRLARAAQLQFIPVTLQTTLGSSARTISVVNRGGGTSTIQVRGMAWTQTPDGKDDLKPSTEIIASPPQFTLPEGETQVVRVIMRTPPSTKELAFRVLVDELPPPNATSVQLALRVSLPVFAVPESGRPDIRWRVVRAGAGVRVIAQNLGAIHAKVTKIGLAGPGRASVQATSENSLPYILAGAERHWAVASPVPAGTQVTLSVEMDGKTVSLTAPVEG